MGNSLQLCRIWAGISNVSDLSDAAKNRRVCVRFAVSASERGRWARKLAGGQQSTHKEIKILPKDVAFSPYDTQKEIHHLEIVHYLNVES